MDGNRQRQSADAPLGNVEPHAHMLKCPPASQLLYKMMKIEDLLRSIDGGYLHFNRVDAYTDGPAADKKDGLQPQKDRPGNASAKFAKDPQFSAADYYDQARARTYACCFSMENTDYIWDQYANSSKKGKVCVVFNFGKLRAILNQSLKLGNPVHEYNGKTLHQIFSINYGIVEYEDWANVRMNAGRLQNPIRYTYLKDKAYFEDEELRISLSAFGLGHFSLADGSLLDFPGSLPMPFDFRAAFVDGTIQKIEYAPDSDTNFIHAELAKLGITQRQECQDA